MATLRIIRSLKQAALATECPALESHRSNCAIRAAGEGSAGLVCQLMKRAAYNLTELTAQVVAGFVSHNTVAVGELPHLIKVIHDALLGVKSTASTAVQRVPAVPIAESVTRDYIVCLDDGQRLKTLKRHILRKYSLSPEAYRARWHLPPDYPMVAPGYAELRSSLAKQGARKR